MRKKVREQYERADELDKLAIAYGSTLQRTIRWRTSGATSRREANPLPYPGVDSRLHKSTF
ncbi:MAG TPA: hypothetical protein VFT23_05320 [Burkholderiales bacterium]|nr:hypothetical protein [Burkholderiales bacterium]